jgi:hypothetical protein
MVDLARSCRRGERSVPHRNGRRWQHLVPEDRHPLFATGHEVNTDNHKSADHEDNANDHSRNDYHQGIIADYHQGVVNDNVFEVVAELAS